MRTATGAELPRLGWIKKPGERFEPQNWHPIRNRHQYMPIKPEGGLWTAPFGEDGLTSWQQWCEEEGYDGDWADRIEVIEPFPDARLVVVESLDDLLSLLDAYSRDDVEPVVSTIWAPLDFEKLAADYDGMWLTEGGQCRTRLSRPSLYGWDCATVLWLQPTFTVASLCEEAT
jgi:hypothetical protein